MTNQEAANLVRNFASDWACGRLSEKTYMSSQYWEALIKAAKCLETDPVDAVGGTYCDKCCCFDTRGYDNPDPEMPDLRMGWCSYWGKNTQACNFCSQGN